MAYMSDIRKWNNMDVSLPIYERIEMEDARTDYPYRYFMYGSLSGIEQDKLFTLSNFVEVPRRTLWEQRIRKVMKALARYSDGELIHISAGDHMQHFHSVVLSRHPIYEDAFMKEWRWATKVIPNHSQRGKELRVYDNARSGLFYLLDHHIPFRIEKIVGHRMRAQRIDSELVDWLNSTMKELWDRTNTTNEDW